MYGNFAGVDSAVIIAARLFKDCIPEAFGNYRGTSSVDSEAIALKFFGNRTVGFREKSDAFWGLDRVLIRFEIGSR